MFNTKIELSQVEQYSLLKNYSTHNEIDKLLVDILNESSNFESKTEQVTSAFGEWSTLQKTKINFGLTVLDNSIGLLNLLLASSLKQINPENITICIRKIPYDKFEFWIVCKTMDYSILDNVYDIYDEYIDKLTKPVEFVFTSEKQFVGKENISFLKVL
jgi:hypothetical protein